MTARDDLLSLVEGGGYDQHYSDLRALQTEAADELFQRRRPAVGILEKRARDAGIERIRRRDDIVPLLLSHTTYKSYPQAFVDRGQWQKMLQWLGQLTAVPVENVDLTGVRSIDDWVERLWAAGYCIYSSSGTSGKCSFISMTRDDRAQLKRLVTNYVGWPRPPKAERSRRLYQLGASKGPMRQVDNAHMLSQVFTRPDAAHFLSDEPLSIALISRNAGMRNAIAAGTAMPRDIAEFEQENAARAERMRVAMDALVDDLFVHRDEPLLVTGPVVQHWALVQKLRAKGMKDGAFHPDSLISTGGGLKGASLPADFAAQLYAFYGNVHFHNAYGMSEISGMFPRCGAGRFHTPAWVLVLLVDRSGERLIDAEEGIVEGRAAFLDLLYEGRWGGLISGDRIKIDYAPRCACGHPGPTILEDINRYTDVGDDKVTCADTIDAYIRGAIGA